jgi:hypothetical protein
MEVDGLPSLRARGRIVVASAVGLEADVYVCEACDALWTHEGAIGPATWVPADLFLTARGGGGGRAALSPVDALSAARAALEADPEDLLARGELAQRLFEAGRAHESLEQYAVILQRRPLRSSPGSYPSGEQALTLLDTVPGRGYGQYLACGRCEVCSG